MPDPIVNVHNTYETAYAANIAKGKKAAHGAGAAAVDADNKRLMKDFVFGSAKNSEKIWESTLSHEDKSLGKYVEQIFKVDLDGDGTFEAYAKAFWDEQGHMYEVQAAKITEPNRFARIDNDTDLEKINKAFVTTDTNNSTNATASVNLLENAKNASDALAASKLELEKATNDMYAREARYKEYKASTNPHPLTTAAYVTAYGTAVEAQKKAYDVYTANQNTYNKAFFALNPQQLDTLTRYQDAKKTKQAQ